MFFTFLPTVSLGFCIMQNPRDTVGRNVKNLKTKNLHFFIVA